MKYRRRGQRKKRDSAEHRRFQREVNERLADLGNTEQLRTLRLAGDRRATIVTRCARCGYQWPTGEVSIVVGSTCPTCNTPLRSCRHCTFFDPKERYECRADIPERIVDKWAGNECLHFRPTEVLDVTGRKLDTARDAKAAFDSLFESS